MNVEQGRAGCAAYGSRLPAFQGKPQGEEAGAAFVGHGITLEVRARRESLCERDVAAARRDDDAPDAVCAQERGQLEDIFFGAVH